MDKVILRQEKVTIPTYGISEYDKNPMFLEKRVYQGSSGRVYPHPVCERVADSKDSVEYNAIFLENDYILVMLLPELGGRVQRLYDKTNGYDAVYYNEVIKPALVGLAGPWISGGIEFNWPQHHRPSTYDAVDYRIEEHMDGSVSVWMGETEKMFHTKGAACFTVYPDKTYLEIRGQLYNPTDRPQTFLWWANPAVAVNDFTQSIFPPDVRAVMDHGKRDVSKFPIADGVYYKVDYAPGTDISMYKNIPVPTSYMAYHSDYDFIGNYDYSKEAGLLHVADHHISPGKKQWTWGNGDFGRAWDRNLTDENGPYIELMTGMFTDNQPDFTFLKPYEEKRFVQYFMPYKGVGAVKNASKDIVMGICCSDNVAEITIYAAAEIKDAVAEVFCNGKVIYSEGVNVPVSEVYKRTVELDKTLDKAGLGARLVKNGRELLACKSESNSGHEIPEPASPLPAPIELETTEKLFLAAVHLEQYRHATYSPEPYYLEGLRRDPADIRLNNGYGKYLYGKGLFGESEKYFREAVKSSTWKNPNPYDCEPYYNLGLALEQQGRREEAFDAYYKAVWDGNMQDRAFYKMACLAAGKGDFDSALEYVDHSLVRGAHNFRARTLKTAILRKTGRCEEAAAFAKESMKTDPLDFGAYYELYKLTGKGMDELKGLLRNDCHNYIELALGYIAPQMDDDAQEILYLAPDCKSPMVHYYLYSLTGESGELEKAEKTSSLYCFPNRLEDIGVLENAAEHGGNFAAYYLGCLLYDKGRWEEAVKHWESCAPELSLPTVYRNLALAYYNKLHEEGMARRTLEKAFLMDTTDARVFFELDQLYKMLNYPTKKRLQNMEDHCGLLRTRDDLYTEYITLLNLNGQYEKAHNCIISHSFHPWEGGEGKITSQYRIALMNMAAMSERDKAIELLCRAFKYPHSLGEGKLAGNMDNDIYYMLGNLYKDYDREKAAKAYRMAARGEFNLSSAMYYNDQPPQMMYYAAKAIEALGDESEANRRFKAFIDYSDEHMQDEKSIDYFAVSLPDFLTFDGDLNKNNRVHCCMMAMYGCLGLGNIEKAREYAQRGMELDCSKYEFQVIRHYGETETEEENENN